MEVLGNSQQKYRFEMNAPNSNYCFIQIYGLVVFFTYLFCKISDHAATAYLPNFTKYFGI